MVSAINPLWPVTGNPTTASVRSNFAAAKSEIEALQAQTGTIGNYLPLTGGTLTGPITINMPGAGQGIQINSTGAAWAQLHFNNTGTGAAGFLQSKRNNLARWSLEFGGSSPETGSNAGTNFLLRAFDDAGVTYKDVIQISRATGISTFGAGITFSGVLAGANDDFSKHIRLGVSAFGINVNGPMMNLGYPAIAGAGLQIVRGTTPVLTFDQSTATFGMGVNFGAQVGASVTDLSKHITLHTGGYGFGITGGRLNYNVNTGSAHVFLVNGVDYAQVANNGITIGNTTLAGNTFLLFNTAAGQNKGVAFRTANLNRWHIIQNSTAESGSNAGSNFNINRYADDGTTGLGTPFAIDRQTGKITVAEGLSLGSTLAASVTDLSKHIALYSTTMGINVTSARQNYLVPGGSTHVFVISGTDILNVVSTGITVTGAIGATGNIVSNSGLVQGASLVANAGSVTTGSNTVAGSEFINGPAAATRQIRWATAGLTRWSFGLDTGAEGGSNAGANYNINRFDDAGINIGTVLSFIRSTGAVLVAQGLSVFNTATPSAKQVVTGSRGGNAALASFLTAMAAFGFITDSTTA